MEHDTTGPESPGLGPTDPADNPESEADLASRLRELEEEAERLRRQLKEQEAEAEPQKPKPKSAPPEAAAEARQPAPKASAEEPSPAEPQVTPEVQAEAENLVRRAKVAKMRGQARECMDLLTQAEKLAPNFPPVLEILGDELAAKSRWKDAQAVYGRAAHLEPGNVGLERKFAQAVLHASVPIEALLMGATSPTSLIEEAANAKTAALWSFFLPGVGQIVLGETAKGIGFLITWLAAWTTAVIMVRGSNAAAGGGAARSDFGLEKLSAVFERNPVVLLPIFIAFVLWVSAIYDAKSHARTVHKPKVDRPVPPVNLPFE